MKSIIKNIILTVKGDAFLRGFNQVPRILFWHGVDNVIDKAVEAEIFDVHNFKLQIDYLQKYYELISMDEFYKRFKNNSFSRKEIVLTFDDGYANNLYQVAPILNELSIPFTVFISTEHITGGTMFPTSVARIIIKGSRLNRISIPSINFPSNISTKELKEEAEKKINKTLKVKPLSEVRQIIRELIGNLSDDEYQQLQEKFKSVRPMNWNEVKRLHELGATIGSHCKYHICCHQNQDKKEVRSQILESKRIIEEQLQTECNYFAYPNGDNTDYSNICIKEAGYLMGFSTNKSESINISSNINCVPRIGVPENFNTFKLFINYYPKK